MPPLRSSDPVIDVQIDIRDDHCYPPQPAQDQTSQRLSHSSDTSILLFTLYLRISEGHDRRKYELLKSGIDSILVFCGLFSATVAALIMPSINGQDPSASSTTPSKNTQTDYFKVEIANFLWFYSLLLSIFCAVHALMLQEWAKPRTWVNSLRYSQLEQARMGAYFAIGIEKAHRTVKFLHCLMIIFLLVFFSGLLTYFFHVDTSFFILPLVLVIAYPLLCLYDKADISLWNHSPHRTPLTSEKIKEQGSRFDGEVLKRTLDMSRSDDDLEQFFEAIPGFCASKIVDNPQHCLDVLGLPRLAEALIGFWNRTSSSNRVPEYVKVRRLVVCVKVIEAADLSIAIPQVLHLFSGDLSEVSRSVKLGHSLRPLRNGSAASLARGIIARIISDAEWNKRWSRLTMDELAISRDALRGYLAHGNSVLLANLIHITRHFFRGLLQPHPDLTRESLNILPSLSKFDILNTLPELQHDFCALWNDVVRQAWSSGAKNNPFTGILLGIRGLYVALHATSTIDYDPLHPPASYLLCRDDSHCNLTTHVEWVGGFTSPEASHTATNFPTSSPVVTR